MQFSGKTKVSVLIPTYNRIKYLPVAIVSILQQTHKNLELIIYDDGSTDGSCRVIKNRFKDGRVRIVRCSENKGVAHARNELLSLATGDVICWQDSDDISNIYRLEYQLRHLSNHDMVFSRYLRFLNKQPQWRRKPARLNNNKRPMASLMIENKELLKYDLAFSGGGEDRDWISRMTKAGKTTHVVGCVLYYMRSHSDRVSVWRRRKLNNPWHKRMAKISRKPNE